MEQEQNAPRNMNRKPYVTGGVSFVVGFLVAWILFSGNGGGTLTPNENGSDATKAAVVDTLGAKNAVTVLDQTPGKVVTVQSITIEREGWVAIHEDREGKPGNILGARKIGAGTTKDFAVPLLRETLEGHTNYVMLHGEDDGDPGFNYKADAPLKDADGNPVMATFKSLAAPHAETQ